MPHPATSELVERDLGEQGAHILGLDTVDEVAEDPAHTGCALFVQAARRPLLVGIRTGSAGAHAGDYDPVADLEVGNGVTALVMVPAPS